MVLDWKSATALAAICLVIGFIVGYALRAAISRWRRNRQI
jgi:ABC-type sulfate transport system permease component